MKIVAQRQIVYKSRTAYNKASSAENQIAGQTQQFYSTLQSQYATQFANQSALLSGLNAAFQPILAGGINQQGFSPQELAAMNTQLTNSVGANYGAARTAAAEATGAAGGGNVPLPTGGQQQLQGEIATSAANALTSGQNQITQANYAQGRQNFLNAAGALGGVASAYNPLGYAGTAGNFGTSAFNEANTVNQQNNAWKSQLGGVLGGIAGSFLGPIGTSIGSQLGSAIGGGGSSGGSSGGSVGGTLGNPYFDEGEGDSGASDSGAFGEG